MNIIGLYSVPAAARLAIFASFTLAASACASTGGQTGEALAAALRRLSADTSITNEVRLADIGISRSMILSGADARREIYLPVPTGVPLMDASIRFDAGYRHSDPGSAPLLLSIDGYPVSSREFDKPRGDAGIVLGIDGAARREGAIRLGVAWTPNGQKPQCGGFQFGGDVLHIEPSTRLTYRYDRTAVHDLASAWGVLPAAPTILIAGGKMDAGSYDTTWRVGVALQLAGKRPKVMALPAVGDAVDLSGITIPAGLEVLPAFAALAEGGKHRLRDAAEIGALLVLGQAGPLRPDVVIADPEMIAAVKTALDALQEQVQSEAPTAMDAYREWRRDAIDPLLAPIAGNDVRLAIVVGRPAIVVASDAGIKAAQLFGKLSNRIMTTATVNRPADPARDVPSEIPIRLLGGAAGTFNVAARRDWNAEFNLGDIAYPNWLPTKAVFDVNARLPSGDTQVASVYLNDILLGAKLMKANGSTEQLVARIPQYALASHNVLRVTFQHSAANGQCADTMPPSSTSVLPVSRVLLERIESDRNFIGMITRFSGTPDVVVPDHYLADAAPTLMRVIRVAAASGVSPLGARMVLGGVYDAHGAVKHAAFLAFDPTFKTEDARVRLDGLRLVATERPLITLLDLAGRNNIGIAEVARHGDRTGVIFRTVGNATSTSDATFRFARGDVAVIDEGGLVAEIDTQNPDGAHVLTTGADPWGDLWREHRVSWSISAVCTLLFVMLVVIAGIVRRRKTKSGS